MIWTDYKHAVVYTCYDVADDGTCRRQGEQLDIMSRKPEMNRETRAAIYEIIREKLCVDLFDLVEPVKEGIYSISYKQTSIHEHRERFRPKRQGWGKPLTF